MRPPAGNAAAQALRAIAALGLGAGAVFAPSGCSSDPTKGYALGGDHRSDVRTVAVPVFDNSTFRHGLEFTLTEALIKEIRRSTPWAVTPSDSAETRLAGAITEVDLRKLGVATESGLVQDLGVSIAVDFEWVDNRTGKTLTARRNFRAAGAFAPRQGIGERLETGEQAAVELLARDIVAELRSDW